MNKLIPFLLSIIFLSCQTEQKKQITQVISFKGQQVTGVTATNTGRLFANFPRWRNNVENSVVEISDSGVATPYPSKDWNNWNLGAPIHDSLFVAVQSVVAFENHLYVLDTRNPLFKGVIGQPRIYDFDLNTNQLLNTYLLSQGSYHHDSYINDLRVDKKLNKIYCTDSGHAGLVIIDMESGNSIRVLDNHESTLAQVNKLTFDNGDWKNTVHSDGVALDTVNDELYFHALSGYKLYKISTQSLNSGNVNIIKNNVQFVAQTPAPDGMIIDSNGTLYLADLEKNKIMQYNINQGELSVLAQGENIKWADTFTLHDNRLYYTNSRINEAQDDISQLEFSINYIEL